MAYTDFTGKVIESAFGLCEIDIAEDVVTGDLINVSGYLADANNRRQADFVCLETKEYDSTGNSNTIRVAASATFTKPASIATGGSATRGDHSGTTGTKLYLSQTAGKPTEGIKDVNPQLVGLVLSQDKVFLCPRGGAVRGINVGLSGDVTSIDEAVFIGGNYIQTGNFDINTNKVQVTAASGNTTVADTCSVTGAATSGAVALNGSLTVSSGTLRLAEKTVSSSETDISTWAFTQITFNSTASITLAQATPTVGGLVVLYDAKGGANHVFQSSGADLSTGGQSNITSTAAGTYAVLLGGGSSTQWLILARSSGMQLS